MKKKKRISINFHLFEQDSLCDYFHDMAAKGWMLQKLNNGWITFTQSEPCDAYFVIDIYHNGSYMNPYNIEEQEIAYSEFIEEYGYELICRTSNYQVYRTNRKIIPIHNEESADMKKKRKRTIFKYEAVNHIFFLFLTFTYFLLFTSQIQWINTFQSNGRVLFLMAPFLFLALSIIKTFPDAVWLIRKEQYHITYPRILKRERIFHIIWILLVLMIVVGFLQYENSSNIVMMAVILILTTVLSFYSLDALFSLFMKKYHGALSCLLTIWVLFTCMNQGIDIMSNQTGETQSASPVSVLTYRDFDANARPIEEAIEEKTDSIFLHTYTYNEYYPANVSYEDETWDTTVSFGYKIYTVKDTLLSDYLIDLIFDSTTQEPILKKETEDWKWYQSNGYYNYIYIDNHIVEIALDECTEEQISMILEKLSL